MIVGVAGSGAAAWFEWTRALSGHPLAWAYSFEWPLFAVMGVYLWWRLLQQATNPSIRPRAGFGLATAGVRRSKRYRATTRS